MNSEMFNKRRILFFIQGCSYCRRILEIIPRINARLPIHKRIKLIDCTYYQRYGILTDPLIALYAKNFTGYPTLFIGPTKTEGFHSKIESEIYMYSHVDKEFIIGESNKYTFNKDCEFATQGKFKGEIICR